MLCVDRCPRGIELPDVMRAFRRVIVEVGAGKIPDSLRITIKNLSAVGNPLGEAAEKRNDWAKDLDVKTYTKGTGLLYFPCCYQVYDSSLRRVARATVNILKKAEVDFGILGDGGVCCGESIRKAGAERLFRNLAQTNFNAFDEAGAKKILVTSPHCYHTFRGEYPEVVGNVDVIHFLQYLVVLIKMGRIKFTKELNKTVTYHDSCCLGRHAGIYDEPRQVLESIPGLKLVEMRDTRQNSLCCGGCAGKLWMETKKGERLADLRIEQALETGASILAVACPYCMLNFEDSVLTSNRGDFIEVKDIIELVNEAL
jgi:Fe-S oxidoreductase